MLEDWQLLKRLRSKDMDALQRLYEKYRDDLFTVAVSLLKDVHVSEDCLQEVFVRLADSPAGFTVRLNLKSYLISCVANCARDCIRSKAAGPDCVLEQLSCADRFNNPVDEAIRRDQSRQILEALSELPYPQREVVVLRVQCGLKFRKIAAMQEVSVKTVLSRYRYGIEKLRTFFGKDD